MHELELKFTVPPAVLASLRDELKRRGGRVLHLQARYFDTADELLGRHGMALRLRREGRRWVQTLKAPGGSLVRRLEHEVSVRSTGGTEPVLDLTRHDGTEAGQALRRLLADAGDPPLVQRYATDIRRLACPLVLGDTRVEAALDIGEVLAGDRRAPVCELELELLGGDSAPLFALARAWAAHGGLTLATTTKLERAALLAAGRRFAPAAKAVAPQVDGTMDGPTLLRAVLRAVLDQVLPNAAALAEGSPDDEQLHQLRVGLRRLRTALRELQALDPGIDPSWTAPLEAAFDALGPLRDEDAASRAVAPLLDAAAAPKLRWEPATPAASAEAIVREPAFQAVLLDLLGFALGPADQAERAATAPEPAQAGATPAPPDPAAAQALVVQRLDHLLRQVARDGRRFDRLPVERQHAVRKRLKRLRYLAEFIAPLHPRKAVAAWLRKVAPAQDALGHHNDVAVAAARFLADAQQDPRAWFAAGYLQAHGAVTARAARRALAAVADARPFWRRRH